MTRWRGVPLPRSAVPRFDGFADKRQAALRPARAEWTAWRTRLSVTDRELICPSAGEARAVSVCERKRVPLGTRARSA